jgi:hypothetical protein
MRSSDAAADLPHSVPAELGLRDQLLSRIRQHSRQSLRAGSRVQQLLGDRTAVRRRSMLSGLDLHHDRRQHELREGMLRAGGL